LAGAPAQDVFVALTDALCPPGGTIDEAIARDALLETIADLAAKGIGNFDELTQDDLQEIFIGVVSRSIEGRILNEVGTNSIKLSPDIAAVDRAQKMLHSFVVGCVRDRFQDSGESVSSLDSGQIDGFVSDLYAASFDLMQTMGEAE
jgi:ABC-type amino acid transport substrate-binding protein